MQARKVRGADVMAAALVALGVKKLFSLSGNHIMSVYDALIDSPITLIHARHEAACVHMADAYARTAGEVGIAMVTAGQGLSNAAAALFTARASNAPVVLLSGHAALNELGRGAFQELRQADLAAPLAKASWTAQSTADLGQELARAMRIASSGRPGPVQLSLPVDLLEREIDAGEALIPDASAAQPTPIPLSDALARRVVEAMADAQRPLVVCGPTLCRNEGRAAMDRLQSVARVPVVGMESPRGVNDPSLGAFAGILKQADLLVLIGKPTDFTLRFANPPFVSADCRLIVIEPDEELLEAARRYHEDRLVLATSADAASAVQSLILAAGDAGRSQAWLDKAKTAFAYRPRQWQTARSTVADRVHPLDICRVLQDFFHQHPDATLVCDGGEIGQWPQAGVTSARRRLINGVAGAIGPSLPFALGVKLAEPSQPVVAVMGDGTFGYHMAEFDTAVRLGLPIIAVVGNDARWNAEYQIQVRDYGAARAKGCELLPARYDKVVEALGGHGEYVTCAAELPAALQRAADSGKPACINVMIESVPAPVIRDDGA
jgi:acetolactate synthase-1/2/3 large subunit